MMPRVSCVDLRDDFILEEHFNRTGINIRPLPLFARGSHTFIITHSIASVCRVVVCLTLWPGFSLGWGLS